MARKAATNPSNEKVEAKPVSSSTADDQQSSERPSSPPSVAAPSKRTKKVTNKPVVTMEPKTRAQRAAEAAKGSVKTTDDTAATKTKAGQTGKK